MMKNRRGGIASLFEIIGASVFLLMLFVIFCSGFSLEFNRTNVVIKGETGGYFQDITMQSYLRTTSDYGNGTTMLDVMNTAIASQDFSLLEESTERLLSQYVYDKKFWYVAVWDMHPSDFNAVLNKYADYDDLEDMMDEDRGKEIGQSKLLVNMHKLEPKSKGENKELQYMQIPYLNSMQNKFMILVFQVGDAE